MVISLVILSLFTIGLQQISYSIYSSLFKFKGLEKQNSIYSLGFIFCLIAVLNFSSFSNLFLIIPSLLFKSNQNIINITPNQIGNFLIVVLFIICIYGILCIFKLLKMLINNNFKLRDDFKIKSLLILLGSLFLTSTIYLAFAPKDIDTGIAYDTGLYHLPFVNYISSFGIEKGMASLQWNYGFYSLQFFGQAVFQKLYNNPNFLSPSLNIIFFSLYMSYFVSHFFFIPTEFLVEIKKPRKIHTPSFFRIFTFIYFFSSILLTSEGPLISLSSYTQNLGIFCCGSILCFIFLSSSLKKFTRYEVIGLILLTFYAPLFKGSGVIIGGFAILILIFNFLFFKNRKWEYKSINIKDFFKNTNYLLITLFIISSYFIAFLTNTISSGYPFYPSAVIGPFGENAVNKIDVVHAKELIINLARFGPSYLNSENLLIDRQKLSDWFPIFLNTRNGVYFVVSSIIPTLLSIFISLFHPKEYSINHKKINLFIFSTCLFFTEFVCMIFLVPELRYYTWFAPVSLFLLFYSSIYLVSFKRDKLLKMGILTYSFFMVSYLFLIWPLSISNTEVLNSISKSFFREPVLTKVKTKTHKMKITKWQPNKLSSDQFKIIRVPIDSDQCWGTMPPCTPYLSEGMPMTIRKMYKK